MTRSDHPLIRTIRLENILSYGGEREPFELGKLNVLIGTNASGKSNLIEVLGLLAEAPRDLLRPIREGVGRRSGSGRAIKDSPSRQWK